MHRLGGRRVSEYTNATHTQLLGVQDQTWSSEIFEAAGLEVNAAPPLVRPGTDIGQLQGPLASLPAFRDTRLIVPACHDTASAIAGIPGQGDDWAFISSGTWSLVGCVLDSRMCRCRGGAKHKFQQRRRSWRQDLFSEKCERHVAAAAMHRALEITRPDSGRSKQLIAACANLDAPEDLLDVDEPDLLLPGDMPARINAQLKRAGRTAIPDGPEMAPKWQT